MLKVSENIKEILGMLNERVYITFANEESPRFARPEGKTVAVLSRRSAKSLDMIADGEEILCPSIPYEDINDLKQTLYAFSAMAMNQLGVLDLCIILLVNEEGSISMAAWADGYVAQNTESI